MATRTRIRHRDIRLVLPQSPAVDKDERDLAKGRYFEADCLATDLIGDFVHITVAAVAGLFQVQRVDVTDATTMPAVGMITEKSMATRCFVQTLGQLGGNGLSPGTRYWVGLSGQISSTPPTPPIGGFAVAQVVAVALDTTALLLRPNFQAVKLRG